MGQRIPPTQQNQLIDWLAEYFKAPTDVFRDMTPDKRWTIYPYHARVGEAFRGQHHSHGDVETSTTSRADFL